jgi:hypothetical protein
MELAIMFPYAFKTAEYCMEFKPPALMHHPKGEKSHVVRGGGDKPMTLTCVVIKFQVRKRIEPGSCPHSQGGAGTVKR